jgi:ATP-dependent Clp protease ATP-binding subunit ClpC
MNWFESAREHLSKWKLQQAAASEFTKTFTPRAVRVLALARQEAERLNHNFVGTEHLLLGLIGLGMGVAVNVLKNLGLNFESVRQEVEKRVGIGPDQKDWGNIPYTPRAKRVLEVAHKQAETLNHTYVGTEHLLLGLLSESEGVAAQVFQRFKIDMEHVRKEILKELTPKFPPGNDTQQQG